VPKLTNQAYAVVFPGQGAQASGMGLAWRDHPAWEVVDQAEKVLDRPLAPLLLGDDSVDLSRTANSQMSVLLTSLMGWRALSSSEAPEPTAFAGHSLGQITALIASEAISFDDGLRLADRRAHLTQRDADSRPGRMAALLGATPEQAAGVCGGVDDCWVANDNTVGQVVIAGTPEGVEAGSEAARAAGIRKVMALDVGGAFHTPLFADAASDLRHLLDELDWRSPAAPIVSNGDGAAIADGAGWPKRLERHLTEPVRWTACMQTLADMAPTWVEVGPGNTLAAFAKRAHSDVTVLRLSDPEQLASVLDALSQSPTQEVPR
jgi:[acyl-carrier-protein] S-malonyltransferase